jgi:hypothetical protein
MARQKCCATEKSSKNRFYLHIKKRSHERGNSSFRLFGTQNYLCYLEDVEIKGKQGERLALCYKFSIHCFFLPLWWTRDGYVLGIIETNAKGTKSWLAKTFYPLTKKNITRGQASGHLPYRRKKESTCQYRSADFRTVIFGRTKIADLRRCLATVVSTHLASCAN